MAPNLGCRVSQVTQNSLRNPSYLQAHGTFAHNVVAFARIGDSPGSERVMCAWQSHQQQNGQLHVQDIIRRMGGI